MQEGLQFYLCMSKLPQNLLLTLNESQCCVDLQFVWQRVKISLVINSCFSYFTNLNQTFHKNWYVCFLLVTYYVCFWVFDIQNDDTTTTEGYYFISCNILH